MNLQTSPIISETEVMETVPLEELAAFKAKEDRAEQCKKDTENSFREFATILNDIGDQKHYRGEYRTFEAYCKGRWNLSRSRAYQIIDARQTYSLLSTTVDKISGRAIRELSGLTDEQKINAGKELEGVQKEKGKVTTKDAKAAAAKVSPEKAAKEAAREEKKQAKIVAQADKLRAAAEKSGNKVKAAKEVADAIQRPARGGLFAEAGKIKAQDAPETNQETPQNDDSPAGLVRAWWAKNRRAINKNRTKPDAIIEKLCKHLEAQ